MVGHGDGLVGVGEEHVQDGERKRHGCDEVDQRGRCVGRAHQGDLHGLVTQRHHRVARAGAAPAGHVHMEQRARPRLARGPLLGHGGAQQRIARQPKPRHGRGLTALPDEDAKPLLGKKDCLHRYL